MAGDLGCAGTHWSGGGGGRRAGRGGAGRGGAPGGATPRFWTPTTPPTNCRPEAPWGGGGGGPWEGGV